MNEKYYIPELEEFYVGFEYLQLEPKEQGDCNTYKKCICSKIELIDIIKSWKYFTEYKVKHLDQEDIESLGWGQGKLSYQFFMSPHFMLVEFQQDNWYSIINTTDEDYKFYGIIKNKSELVKLMKQLNIK